MAIYLYIYIYITGAINTAVNNVANVFWKNRPREMKHIKYLRLEVSSPEKKQIVKDKSYLDFSDQNPDKPRFMRFSATSESWSEDHEYLYWVGQNMALVDEMAVGADKLQNGTSGRAERRNGGKCTST